MKSAESMMGVTIETTSGTYVAPTSADVFTVTDIRPSIQGLTNDVREYTGSIHRPGASVSGKTFEVTAKMYLRGPGGANPPAAGVWIPGRVFRAAGFAESILSAAVPAAPEALGGGTTTTATLGTTAVGTADLYNGLAIHLAALNASMPKGLTMIRDYSAGKVATLAEVAGGALSGNYQIPKQLAYLLSTGAPPTLSVSLWLGGKRYNGVGCAVSAFKINLPTKSRQSQEDPSIEFTITGDFQSDADEAAPTLSPTIAIPGFKDGKLWIANTNLGGSSLSIDLAPEVDFRPNPNKVNGSEAAQVVGTQRSVSLTLNQVTKATLDLIGLADAQAYHAVMAMYGSASGNFFGVMVTDARFNYQSPDLGGNFVTTQGEMLIDGIDKTIALTIPFGW